MNNTPQSCAYCGSPLTPGARFCDSCGQPVSAAFQGQPEPDRYNPPLEETEPASVSAPPPASPQAPQGAPATESLPPRPSATTGSYQTAAPQGRSRWPLPVLVAIGCGIVLCCLAIMAVLAATGLWVLPARSVRSTPIPIEATVEMEPLVTSETADEEAALPVAQAPTIETESPQDILLETGAPTDLPVETESPTATPTVTEVPAEAAAATPAPLTATEETGPPESGEEIMEFRGIEFTYSSALASDILAELMPGEGGEDLPYWRIYPDYWQFTFRGYPQGANDQAPRLMVFPVEAYVELNPEAQEIVGRLQGLLKNRPSSPDPETLPYLPFVNAHAFIKAKIHYLDFENGAGISYLTQFAQDVSPVTNTGLIYTFQGLTRTGQYYISAVLPVSHPDLLAEYEIPGGDIEAFIQGYDQYLQETRQQLNAYLPGGFTPHLEVLDALFQSLLVKPKKN